MAFKVAQAALMGWAVHLGGQHSLERVIGSAIIQSVLHFFVASQNMRNDVADIRTDDLMGDYPAVRYYPPSGDLYFDVLTRLGDAASFETVEAETFQVGGVAVRVATSMALYQLKKGTVRPIDQHDAIALRLRFGLKDEG